MYAGITTERDGFTTVAVHARAAAAQSMNINVHLVTADCAYAPRALTTQLLSKCWQSQQRFREATRVHVALDAENEALREEDGGRRARFGADNSGG